MISDRARAVSVARPGGYGRLRVVDVPIPEPGEGEVRVRVEAVGVNFADCLVRAGLYASSKVYVGWPVVPGFDFAGRVDSVGPGVTATAVGEDVVGVTRFGAYASHVCVDARQVIARPPPLDAVTAAAIPTAFLTAWYALERMAHVEPGDRVLVHSAAGGVGSALVQLALDAGAQVVAVVGAAHKVAAVRELGCEHVVDKGSEELWPRAEELAPDGFQAVFDANGPSTLRASFEHLAPEGRLVVYGFHSAVRTIAGVPNPLRLAWSLFRTPCFRPMEMTRVNRSVLAFNLSFLFDRVDVLRPAVEHLVDLVARGRLRVPEVTTFPLEEAAEAQRRLESGSTVGKLVLIP